MDNPNHFRPQIVFAVLKGAAPPLLLAFLVLAFSTKLPHSIRRSSRGLHPTLFAQILAKSPSPKPHPSSAEQNTTSPFSGLKVHSSTTFFFRVAKKAAEIRRKIGKKNGPTKKTTKSGKNRQRKIDKKGTTKKMTNSGKNRQKPAKNGQETGKNILCKKNGKQR